jgi:uncharacterized ubiquitin-like protein YukD
LQYLKKFEWDLSLPVDVPMSILLPQIMAQKCGEADFPGNGWQIRIRDSGDFITPEQTLSFAGILPGDILVVQASIGAVPDFSQTQVVGDARAVLIGEFRSFPVKQKNTTIGRLDLKNGVSPEVDLTSLDKNGKVSRFHAQINIIKAKYIIHDLKSKNGTYVNGEKLGQDVRRELVSGDIIQFGDDPGVVVKFKINS